MVCILDLLLFCNGTSMCFSLLCHVAMFVALQRWRLESAGRSSEMATPCAKLFILALLFCVLEFTLCGWGLGLYDWQVHFEMHTNIHGIVHDLFGNAPHSTGMSS